MNTLRPIRLLRPWGEYSKGHEFSELQAGVARELVETGGAEYLDTEISRAPADRMLRSRRAPTRAAVS